MQQQIFYCILPNFNLDNCHMIIIEPYHLEEWEIVTRFPYVNMRKDHCTHRAVNLANMLSSSRALHAGGERPSLQ
jgi:hypothetical protein